MILSALIFLVSQAEAEEPKKVQPIQTLKSSLSLELKDWGLRRIPIGTLPSDLVKEDAKPLVLFLKESILVPERSDHVRFWFSRGNEIQSTKPLEEWTDLEWKAFNELDPAICEFSYSDVQLVSFPPHMISARALLIEKLELTSKESHQQVKFIFKSNPFFKEVVCAFALNAEIDQLDSTLPAFASIVLREDETQPLPEELKAVAAADFDRPDLLSERPINYFVDLTAPSDLTKYLSEPQWNTRKGFDSWGYYEKYETPLGKDGRLRFEFRRYDQYTGPYWRRPQ